MAETEVSKMVAIEEKCGLDKSSYKDLPKFDCNGINHHTQTNDLDNSYVFVNGADGLPDGAVGCKGVIVGGSSVLPEPEGSETEKIGAVGEGAPHLNEGVNGNIELSNGDLNLVNCNTSKLEGSHKDGEGVQVSLTDYPVLQTCKAEQVSFADSQEVLTETTRSVAEADIEKIVEQNEEIEGLVGGGQEDIDGVTIAEPPPLHVENPEFEVRASELEAEIGNNRESNNIFLNSNSSNGPNDGEDQHSTSVTEALEASQRFERIVVDVDEHELQSVGVDAEDEAKSPRELAEVAEPEVSASTSLDSKLFSISNKDKKLEEEAKMDLSLSVHENQNSDTGASNTVHKRVGETNESKPVGCSSDSDVLSTRGLILEEKIDSVSAVENGVQYLEESQEQPMGTSSDSHVQTTSDLVLEEKNEESFVSDVGNGAQYHEESEEQLADRNSVSRVQTTCDLALEDKNEDLFVSGVANGAQYHEEIQAQPVVSSTDSQGQTTCDLASEGCNEISSVSAVENGAQYHEGSQEQPSVSISCDLVLEEKDEAPSVSDVENGSKYPEDSLDQSDGCEASHDTKPFETMSDTSKYPKIEVENGSRYPEDSQEQSDGCGASHDTTPSETMPDASVQIQSNPASNPLSPQSGTEISDVEEIERVSSTQESQIIKNVVHGHDSEMRFTLDEVNSGSDCALDKVVKEKEITSEGGDETHSKTEASSGKSEVGDRSPGTLDVKLEPYSHVHDVSDIINEEKSDDLTVSCTTDISDSLDRNSDAVANIELDVDGVMNMVDKLDDAAGNSEENMFVQENENTRNSQNEETSVALAEVSPINATDGEDKSIKIKTKPFNFLIRTPRFDDEDLREQIRLAKLQVDEKTKLRDAIQLQIQEKRANSQINGIDCEFSKGEGRSARKLVRSKRMEIDSLQSVINKAKNALSIEDIDSQIHNMEHMIQHETLPLKEEKQLIREIKQLKQLREQLSSNMGSQDEIKQVLEQREETEERLKILRKELDILKNRVLKAEAVATEAEKKYDDENRKVKELQAQFRAADEVRQAAYAQWQNLRKEFSKKNKYFFKYKDDAAVASNYAFSRDSEALYRLCTNQVGSFMKLWNTNPEFRRDYVKFNARSNIRRFGTLDCRSLGPDEEPPAKPSYADERGNRLASTPAKDDLAPQNPSVDLKQKTPSENVTSISKSIPKAKEPKGQKVLKGPSINVQVNGFDVHASDDLTDEVHEEPVKSKEDIESMRKAEELRKEKAEAMLKEQRRLEALEKANEARERKKRQAEKLQQRAELKTQKEAEQREKEREKRQRKKQRKKAGVLDATDTTNNCETAPSSESAAENSKEIDAKDVPPAAAKKPQKPWLATKQSKTKSIPPALRNKNKKKLQQWMWVGITSFLILVLFWLGNIGVFSDVALKRRAPVY